MPSYFYLALNRFRLGNQTCPDAIGNRQSEMLIHSFDDRRLQLCKRPDIAHSIPRIDIAGWFSLRLVAFEKARHEEFLRQSRQTDAARFTIIHQSFRVVRL